MDLFFILMREVGVMVCLIVLGAFTRRIGIMTTDTARRLADFLVVIVMPILLINLYQRERDPALMPAFWAVLAFSAAIFAIYILIAMLVFRKKDGQDRYRTNRLAVVIPNSGFMGIPLLLAALGPESIIYSVPFMGIFQVMSWGWAIPMVEGRRPNLKQVIITPGVVAFLAGLVLFLLDIRLPEFVISFTNYVTNLNTPLSMLMIGIFLSDLDIIAMLKTSSIHIATFWRNIAMPLLTILALWIIRFSDHFGHMASLTLVITSSCACGASVLLLPLRAGGDSEYAAQLVAESSVLSVITLPFIVFIAEKIL